LSWYLIGEAVVAYLVFTGWCWFSVLFSACMLIAVLNPDSIRQIPVCIVVEKYADNFFCVILCDVMCMRVYVVEN
jgi:hypothetical protein